MLRVRWSTDMARLGFNLHQHPACILGNYLHDAEQTVYKRPSIRLAEHF